MTVRANLSIMLFLILTLLSTAAYGDDKKQLKNITTKAVTVHYTPGLKNAAQRLSRDYPSLLNEAMRTLSIDRPMEGTVNIVLLPEGDFAKTAWSPHVKAYASSDRGLIVLNYDSSRADPLVHSATLKHEIAHLLIGRSASIGNIPLWLNEGMAQWASGGHSEIRDTGPDWLVAKAALTGRLIPLGQLEASFPPDEAGMRLAYAQSIAVMDTLTGRHGPEFIGRFLTMTLDGMKAEDAFYQLTGVTLNEFSNTWAYDTRERATILIWLQGHFYEALFLFASLALIVAFARTIYRIKTYKDEPEEDEPEEDEPEEDEPEEENGRYR